MKKNIFLLCLMTIFPWLAQAGESHDFSCAQATTLSMLAPDSVPKLGSLLLLRNLSWSAEFFQYVMVPALEFDLSSVPKNAVIESAVLKLSFYGRGTSPMRPTVRIYPITTKWSAASATWNTKPSWNENFAEIEVPPQPNDDSTQWEMDITPLVRKWVNGDMENHGMAIVSDSIKGDCYNFAFYGPAAGDGHAPVLTMTFAK
jgi:hypothetical protein